MMEQHKQEQMSDLSSSVVQRALRIQRAMRQRGTLPKRTPEQLRRIHTRWPSQIFVPEVQWPDVEEEHQG